MTVGPRGGLTSAISPALMAIAQAMQTTVEANSTALTKMTEAQAENQRALIQQMQTSQRENQQSQQAMMKLLQEMAGEQA